MIITQTSGCIVDSLTIDGVEIKDIPKDEIKNIYFKLMAYILTHEKDYNILDILSLIDYSDFKMDDEPCEQCGDYIYTTTWGIKI